MPKTSDSIETYYKFKKINETNPILFIHGIGLTNEMWDQQIDYFKNYNTIVYDLMGHGKTPLNNKKVYTANNKKVHTTYQNHTIIKNTIYFNSMFKI